MLSPHYREVLRERFTSDMLPYVEVYRTFSGDHLAAACAPSVPVVSVPFLEADLPEFCRTCRYTPTSRRWERLAAQLSNLTRVWDSLEYGREVLFEARSYRRNQVTSLGNVLDMCETVLSDDISLVRDSEVTARFAPRLEGDARKLRSDVIALLRSSKGRAAFSDGPSSAPIHANAFLLLREHMFGFYTAVAAAYSEDFESDGDVLLARAPSRVVADVVANGFRFGCALFLEDEPPEVLEAVRVLWNPLEDGPLSTGEGVLSAARILVSS